jgi:hypothetical protein
MNLKLETNGKIRLVPEKEERFDSFIICTSVKA